MSRTRWAGPGSAALTVALCVASARWKLGWISEDDRVVIQVLALFLIATEGLRESGYLQRLVGQIASANCSDGLLIGGLVLTAAALAAAVTNDVSLFAVVPVTIGVCRKRSLGAGLPVVLETMAANTGSSAMPWGNPQNIFLFHRFEVHPGAFYRLMSGPTLLMTLLLAAAAWRTAQPGKKEAPIAAAPTPVQHRIGLPFAALLILGILVVIRLAPLAPGLALAVALVVAFVVRRQTIAAADWTLLLLFCGIFIGTHALEQSALSADLEALFAGRAWVQTYLVSALLSQAVSNVPTALLGAGPVGHAAGFTFTRKFAALLMGVNAGGLGTPIASLANLIAARVFTRETGDSNDFYRSYWKWNTIGLAVFLLIGAGDVLFLN